MKVLLATDGSSHATHAAKFLSELPLEGEFELTVLTVTYDPAEHTREKDLPWISEFRQRERASVQKHHAEIQEMFAGRCESPSTLHHTGDAVQEILSTATRISADLIVLGAVGHSMISRMFLGSVSDAVATLAGCSVLAVRPAAEDAPAGPRASNIVIAYDGSDASRESVNEMLEIGWSPETEVHVLTVAPNYDFFLGDGLSGATLMNEEEIFESMRGKTHQVTESIATKLPRAKTEILSGYHIGNTIVDFAERQHSDLIIVGDTGHGMLHELVLGNTTKYILRHASCSVWISRHHRSVTETEDAETSSQATA